MQPCKLCFRGDSPFCQRQGPPLSIHKHRRISCSWNACLNFRKHMTWAGGCPTSTFWEEVVPKTQAATSLSRMGWQKGIGRKLVKPLSYPGLLAMLEIFCLRHMRCYVNSRSWNVFFEDQYLSPCSLSKWGGKQIVPTILFSKLASMIFLFCKGCLGFLHGRWGASFFLFKKSQL